MFNFDETKPTKFEMIRATGHSPHEYYDLERKLEDIDNSLFDIQQMLLKSFGKIRKCGMDAPNELHEAADELTEDFVELRRHCKVKLRHGIDTEFWPLEADVDDIVDWCDVMISNALSLQIWSDMELEKFNK